MLVPVLVKPKASRSRVIGVKERVLQVQVAAAPQDGKANAELVTTLAEFFDLKRSAVKLVAGLTSRHKRVELRGLSLSDISRRLQDL